MLEKIFTKIHNEGYKFIVIFVFATIILYFIHGFLGFIGLVLSIWCYYFFRDPERISIGDEDYLTSYIQMAAGGFGRFYGAQNDILWRNSKTNSINIKNWQAITYKGENYIDAGYDQAKGIMFKTGSINPITGV